LHAQQLHEGEDFKELQPTISICFLKDILYPTMPEYQWYFGLRDERHPGLVFSPHLEIHLFELPKFQLPPEALDTPLEKWLYFLKHAARLDTDKLPANLQVPEIQQALEELIMVTQSDRDWAKYEERFRAELEARSFKPVLLEEGRREGPIGRIHLCQKLLRQPQSIPEEFLGLGYSELQRLAELWEQKAISGLRPVNGTPDPGPTTS
jgi:predicted transposase/invertase (TIGR01784 family)